MAQLRPDWRALLEAMPLSRNFARHGLNAPAAEAGNVTPAEVGPGGDNSSLESLFGLVNNAGGMAQQFIQSMVPDFTPSPERQAEIQAQVARQMAEEKKRRKAQEEALRRYIDESMQQPPAQAVPPTAPGGLIPQTEGGNPAMDQMSPAIIDALRRSGAM